MPDLQTKAFMWRKQMIKLRVNVFKKKKEEKEKGGGGGGGARGNVPKHGDNIILLYLVVPCIRE